mgnify:CR=1 FL=1
MLYIIIAVIAALFSGHMFSKYGASLSLYKLNMMSWSYYIAFIAYSLIGAVLVVNQWDGDFVNQSISNPASRETGYWAVVWTVVAFPFGMILSNRIFRRKNVPKYFDAYIKQPIYKERNESGMMLALILASVVDILLVAYVFACYGTIPIIELIKNPNIDVSMVRYETSRDFSGSYSLKTIATILTPLLSYASIIYLKRKKNLFVILWASFMFILALCMSASTFEKSSVFLFLVSYLFLFVYVRGRITKMQLLIGATVAILVLFVSFMMLASATSEFMTIGELAEMIGQRIFVVQIESTFLHFDNFPNHIDFIGFKSLFSPGMSQMLGLDHVDVSAKQMMDMFNSSDTAGVRNSLFISEAYANFGWVGVFLSPFYVGFVVQTIFTFLLYSKKTPYMVALLTYFSIHNHLTQGVNYYIFSEEIIWIIFISIGLYICASFFQGLNNKQYQR